MSAAESTSDWVGATVTSHPLVVVFLGLEVALLLGGYLLDLYAEDVAAGSQTSLAHTAGVFGALAMMLGIVGVVAMLVYAGFSWWNRRR